MYAHVKIRLFKAVWYERVVNFIWNYSRVIIENVSFGTAQMLSIWFYFFTLLNDFIAKLQLLPILSLVLSTKQLYSYFSLVFTNQSLIFLIYLKQLHKRNAIHEADPKKDAFVQVYSLHTSFVHNISNYRILYNRLALFSLEIGY